MAEREAVPVVRPMTVRDFAPVYELGLECYDVLDKPYNYWTVTEVADHLGSHPHLCFVAEADGAVVGFALGAESFELLEQTGHLEWIAVAAAYRRHGVARRLVEAALEAYRRLGKAQVVADVAATNEASREFARKLGFTEGVSVTFFVKSLSE